MGRAIRPSLSFLNENSPDGFRDEEPTWVAYCPDRDVKRTLSEHEQCQFFGGMETAVDGSEVAFRCALRRH